MKSTKKNVDKTRDNAVEKPPMNKKLKIFLIVCLVLMGVGFLSFAGLAFYYAKDLPNPGKINKRVVAESTKIYDRTGEHLLYEIHGEERRTIIPFSDIPDSMKFATIALEDQKFYSHYGIDFKSIMRSVVQDVLRGSKAQGGSTITQQFVKNSILTKEKSFERKLKEVILSVEIEQKFSKDEILQMYLNEIPYGSNAYGIEAASQTFFGKPAKELTLAQSAMLASLPQAPSRYSPSGSHTDLLNSRWQYCLDQMAKLGYITQEQADEAKNEDVLAQIKPLSRGISAPHFVLYVKEQLANEFGETEIETKGLKVYTTLDWDMQQIAERAVREGVEANGEKYKFSNAALVAANPQNGNILAMVGSKDYFDETIDGNVNVATRLRQPGSSFKPYVYAKAFEKGYTPDTILFDVDTKFETNTDKDYNPKNYDNKNRGPVKMKEALAMSLNVPAVKALYLAGVQDSIKLAQSMGITTLQNPARFGLALVLGGGEVKLVDHVNAFGTFANKGMHVDKTAILRIEDANGETIKNYENREGKQVLDKNVALQMTQIMSDNSLRAPVFGSSNALVIPGHQVAAKTGTTNEWRDGWLVGSTPSLSAGVWAGNNDNTAMAQGADGSYVAGPIWNSFMAEALKNYQNEEFEKPQEVKTNKPILDGTLDVDDEIEVCKDDDGDYCLASSDCPDSLKKKKKFFNAHSILYYVDRTDPRGEYPQKPQDDPQFKNWEKAVEEWAKDKYDDLDAAPEKECRQDDFDEEDVFSSIKITQPSSGEVVKNRDFKIKVDISGNADVDQVDFFFDDEPIGSRKHSPYEVDYKIPSSLDGKTVPVRVKLYDDEGGKDEDQIQVTVDFDSESEPDSTGTNPLQLRDNPRDRRFNNFD